MSNNSSEAEDALAGCSGGTPSGKGVCMLSFSFFRKTLDAMTDAKTMRSAIAYILKILGILDIDGGFYHLVELLKNTISFG